MILEYKANDRKNLGSILKCLSQLSNSYFGQTPAPRVTAVCCPPDRCVRWKGETIFIVEVVERLRRRLRRSFTPRHAVLKSPKRPGQKAQNIYFCRLIGVRDGSRSAASLHHLQGTAAGWCTVPQLMLSKPSLWRALDARWIC